MTAPYPYHAEQTDDIADINHNSSTGVIHTVWCIAVQCSAVKCIAVKCTAVQYSTIQCGASVPSVS
jgi:hypothetical protein